MRKNVMEKWHRLKYQPVLPLGENGEMVTGSAEHIALSRRAAAEGMVLLKNRHSVLPLHPENCAALFGKASADYIKGGGGSGDVTVRYVRQFYQAMQEKQAEGKVQVFEPLNAFYAEYVTEMLASGKSHDEIPEPELPAELMAEASEHCDTAIISICCYSKEGNDQSIRENDGDFYLSPAEQALVRRVTASFARVVVVLNVGGIVDTAWFRSNDRIQSVLLAWQGGMEGASAQADILCGDVCPSGKLTDTFAASIADYPSTESFFKSEERVEYTEDIFVGYRYFETIPGAAEKVQYPFGFGLSYTTFAIRCRQIKEEGGELCISAQVTNTGTAAGREVVQLYVAAPAGRLDMPSRELRGFIKTGLLKPGGCEEVQIRTKIADWASYDENLSAYVLLPGEYELFLGNSIRDTERIGSLRIEQERVVQQLRRRCAPRKLSKRLRADGTYQPIATGEYEPLVQWPHWPPIRTGFYWEDMILDRNTPCGDRRPEVSLEQVAQGELTLDQFLEKLSDDELITLLGGAPPVGPSHLGGIGGLTLRGIPNAMTADGPAGFRVRPGRDVCTTAWPVATLIACSWDAELACQIGRAGAQEVRENNCAMWLTPGINIHRNPCGGRNFEYYSEDPLVTGVLAAAMIRGIQSQGIGAAVKHLCCNNREWNRAKYDSAVSERALREIYLRAFQMTMREEQPRVVMSAYNLLNGRKTSENAELLTGILREEWGFRGLVVTDWGNLGEHYRELLAGNDVKMPAGSPKRLQNALKMGLISRENLVTSVRRVLQYILQLD